jgi:hypothetical protein
MPIRRRHRKADSPFVERISHVVYDGAAGGLTTPDGCWDIVFRRRRGAMEVLQTGLITRPIPLDYECGDEYLCVSFKPGVFMPMLPGARMLDRAFLRPSVGKRAFWLDGDVMEVPSFDNAEGMVARIARRGLLTRDDVVTRVLDGERRALSQRSVQRHFRHILGVTSKSLQQVLRARRAVELLQRGRPIITVVQDLGFSDQAHLTRSLRRLVGETPGAIVRAITSGRREGAATDR